MYRKARATAATLGMALTLTTGQALAQSGDQHALGRRIEGAWVVQKTPHDCQTGAEFSVTTPELATFFEGGVTIATAGISAAVLSTGHGIWTYTGASGFHNKFHGLLFTPAGSVARIITVTREIVLSPTAPRSPRTMSPRRTISRGISWRRGVPQPWALAWTEQDVEYPPGRTRPRPGKAKRGVPTSPRSRASRSSRVALAALGERQRRRGTTDLKPAFSGKLSTRNLIRLQETA